MTRYRPIILVLAALLLGACTTAQQAAVNGAVQNIKTLNDGKAKLAKETLCGVSLGSYNRVFSSDERDAAMTMCGGKTLRALLEQLARPQAMP